MSLYLLDQQKTEIAAEQILTGAQLRAVRRSRGLSQAQLADLIGIAQPNISNWESGKEEASQECMKKLADILLNRSGKLDRYVELLAQRDPHINIFSLKKNKEMRFLHLAEMAKQAYQLENSECLGRDVNQMFDTEWEDDIFDGVDFKEIIFSQYAHDMTPLTGQIQTPVNRIYVSSFVMDFDGFDTILITNTCFTAATGESPSQQKQILAHELVSHNAGNSPANC